jgi:capsular polysaccharide biosynthesis protein/Mrp family chromosome partitioning ATPase
MDDDSDAPAPAPTGDDLLGHLRTLRAGWWLVLSLTAVGLLAGTAVALLSPTVYESATSVLVLPTGLEDANATGGRTHGTVNLDTEAQLVTSTAVAGRARVLLHTGTPAAALANRVSVSVPPNSTVLDITYSAPTAAAAQAGSHAFAAAYLANRGDSATSAAAGRATALRTQIQQVTVALQQLAGRIAGLPAGSAERVYLDSQRANLANQLNALTDGLNTLTTTTITAGRIISDAPRPHTPTSPSLPVDAAAGLLTGLLAGLAAALLYGRLDRRVRRAGDLPRRASIRVLAALTDPTAPTDGDLFTPRTPAGRLFARLRNELTATGTITTTPPDPRHPTTNDTGKDSGTRTGADSDSGSGIGSGSGGEAKPETAMALETGKIADSGTAGTGDADGVSGRVIVVVGTSDGRTARVVAENLGDAINRAAGERPAERAVVLADCAEPVGDVPAETRERLAELRGTAGHVLVVTPDAAAGPEAQTLAGLADAALLAVELHHSRYDGVVDAAQQLRRVGTPVLGAVVLPRLTPIPQPTAHPAAHPQPNKPHHPDNPQHPEAPEDIDHADAPEEAEQPDQPDAANDTGNTRSTAEAKKVEKAGNTG